MIRGVPLALAIVVLLLAAAPANANPAAPALFPPAEDLWPVALVMVFGALIFLFARVWRASENRRNYPEAK